MCILFSTCPNQITVVDVYILQQVHHWTPFKVSLELYIRRFECHSGAGGRENPIRCGHWCTVVLRDRLAQLKMDHSAQLIKMSSVQALQVQGKYPHGIFFSGHVDPLCHRLCSRWLFSGCHWLPRKLHKHLALFHLIRLEGFQ